MSTKANKTMLQAFEWYLKPDFNHWNHLREIAPEIKSYDIEMVWLPPAYKEFRKLLYFDQDKQCECVTADAVNATGYGVYDKYDLGEFPKYESKELRPAGETSKTKYGSREEYEQCIKAFQNKPNHVDVIVDIVLNHMFGAEATEKVSAYKYLKNGDRTNPIGGPYPIDAPTVFHFPDRKGAYNKDSWDHNDFNAVSYGDENAIFLFEGKEFNPEVDEGRDIDGGNNPYRNFDYLMGSNIDFTNPATQRKLLDWVRWYLEVTNADGIRLDAVKHIDFRFIPKLMEEIHTYKSEDFFAVGEYWSDTERYGELLQKYLDKINTAITLFDVPLHRAFTNAFDPNQRFDLREIFKESIVTARADSAVTFVDNHDSQPGQMLGPNVNPAFRQHAYSLILFRKGGLPCVFYGDLYGIPHDQIPPVPLLGKMCKVRKSCAHGDMKEYWAADLDLAPLDLSDADENERNRRVNAFNQVVEENNRRKQYYGFSRFGIKDYKYSGMAVLVSNGCGGSLRMHIKADYAGERFVNMLNLDYEYITLNSDGDGNFFVWDNGAAVWIRECAYNYIFNTTLQFDEKHAYWPEEK